MSAPRADVLILGGGVIGLACALVLLRRGRSVTVLEKGRAGSGASHGNCGTITPSLLPLPAPGVMQQALKWMTTADSPLLVRPTLDPSRLRWLLRFAAHSNEKAFRRALRIKLPLLLQSRALLERWVQEEKLDCEFSPSGHLQVYRDPALFERAQQRAPWAAEFGLESELLDGAELRRREPALNEAAIGGVYNPGDAQLRPDRFVAELVRRVRERGGVIVEQAAVTGLLRESGRITSVATAAGTFSGDAVVMALGAWSPALARQLELRLPLQPGKGYSLTYAAAQRPPRIPLVLMERRVCVTAWASGYRLGSTLEFSGFDESLNRPRLEALRRGAQEYLREPPAGPALEEWFGWRPMTWDDLPVIGRAPGLKNLWLATGHGMLGVTLSAITGELIGELLSGSAPRLDLAPFSPERFA